MKTIIEFAKEKDCSRQTIYNAINRNELDTTEKYGKTLLNATTKNKNWVAVLTKKRLKNNRV